jgi:hypothetical protein
MAEKEISVLISNPHSKPDLSTIENTPEKIKELVGGDYYIDITEEDGLSVVYNPVAGEMGYDLNRLLRNEPVFGTIIICRSKDGELFSLSEDEIEELNYMLS